MGYLYIIWGWILLFLYWMLPYIKNLDTIHTSPENNCAIFQWEHSSVHYLYLYQWHTYAFVSYDHTFLKLCHFFLQITHKRQKHGMPLEAKYLISVLHLLLSYNTQDLVIIGHVIRRSYHIYHKISNIRCTKWQKLNDPHFILQLSLHNSPLKLGIKSRMKM